MVPAGARDWQHVAVSRSVGISSAEIERVTQGADAPGWTPHEAALLRAVEELRANVMVSNATWAVLAETFDEAQLFELLVLTGQFTPPPITRIRRGCGSSGEIGGWWRGRA